MHCDDASTHTTVPNDEAEVPASALLEVLNIQPFLPHTSKKIPAKMLILY